jgi:CheY-like chemotaxis protein
MVYGFARQSGGYARIHSDIGVGTSIAIYLPRAVGQPECIAQVAQSSAPENAREGETVLIVDDEAAVRMLVAEVLGDLQYKLMEAENGKSALQILESNQRIDLLITDVGLPGGLNGRQLADAARVLRPELKVIFITGYAESAATRAGKLQPGMHIVTKPFAIDALANRVTTILAGA